MEWIDRVEEIISSNNWVKNDIGMGRVQCSKLVKEEEEEELMLIIVSDTLDNPISCRVEKVLVINEEIILFYDGEYCESIESDEYNRYEKFLSKQEWEIIFNDHPIEKLRDFKLISNTDGYYAEIHETVGQYMERGYDKRATEEISEKYNLI